MTSHVSMSQWNLHEGTLWYRRCCVCVACSACVVGWEWASPFSLSGALLKRPLSPSLPPSLPSPLSSHTHTLSTIRRLSLTHSLYVKEEDTEREVSSNVKLVFLVDQVMGRLSLMVFLAGEWRCQVSVRGTSFRWRFRTEQKRSSDREGRKIEHNTLQWNVRSR